MGSLYPEKWHWDRGRKYLFSQGPGTLGCQPSLSEEPWLECACTNTVGRSGGVKKAIFVLPPYISTLLFHPHGNPLPMQSQVQPAFYKFCAQITAFDGITDTVVVWDTPLKSLVRPGLCNLVVAHRKCWEPDSFCLCSRP